MGRAEAVDGDVLRVAGEAARLDRLGREAILIADGVSDIEEPLHPIGDVHLVGDPVDGELRLPDEVIGMVDRALPTSAGSAVSTGAHERGVSELLRAEVGVAYVRIAGAVDVDRRVEAPRRFDLDDGSRGEGARSIEETQHANHQ